MELKLHASGKRDHLKELKVWFKKQVELLKSRTDLPKQEKATQLDTLRENYKEQKKSASHNLY